MNSAILPKREDKVIVRLMEAEGEAAERLKKVVEALSDLQSVAASPRYREQEYKFSPSIVDRIWGQIDNEHKSRGQRIQDATNTFFRETLPLLVGGLDSGNLNSADILSFVPKELLGVLKRDYAIGDKTKPGEYARKLAEQRSYSTLASFASRAIPELALEQARILEGGVGREVLFEKANERALSAVAELREEHYGEQLEALKGDSSELARHQLATIDQHLALEYREALFRESAILAANQIDSSRLPSDEIAILNEVKGINGVFSYRSGDTLEDLTEAIQTLPEEIALFATSASAAGRIGLATRSIVGATTVKSGWALAARVGNLRASYLLAKFANPAGTALGGASGLLASSAAFVTADEVLRTVLQGREPMSAEELKNAIGYATLASAMTGAVGKLVGSGASKATPKLARAYKRFKDLLGPNDYRVLAAEAAENTGALVGGLVLTHTIARGELPSNTREAYDQLLAATNAALGAKGSRLVTAMAAKIMLSRSLVNPGSSSSAKSLIDTSLRKPENEALGPSYLLRPPNGSEQLPSAGITSSAQSMRNISTFVNGRRVSFRVSSNQNTPVFYTDQKTVEFLVRTAHLKSGSTLEAATRAAQDVKAFHYEGSVNREVARLFEHLGIRPGSTVSYDTSGLRGLKNSDARREGSAVLRHELAHAKGADEIGATLAQKEALRRMGKPEIARKVLKPGSRHSESAALGIHPAKDRSDRKTSRAAQVDTQRSDEVRLADYSSRPKLNLSPEEIQSRGLNSLYQRRLKALQIHPTYKNLEERINSLADNAGLEPGSAERLHLGLTVVYLAEAFGSVDQAGSRLGALIKSSPKAKAWLNDNFDLSALKEVSKKEFTAYLDNLSFLAKSGATGAERSIHALANLKNLDSEKGRLEGRVGENMEGILHSLQDATEGIIPNDSVQELVRWVNGMSGILRESRVAITLINQGFSIDELSKRLNHRGRPAEIDIVASRNGEEYYIEVKKTLGSFLASNRDYALGTPLRSKNSQLIRHTAIAKNQGARNLVVIADGRAHPHEPAMLGTLLSVYHANHPGAGDLVMLAENGQFIDQPILKLASSPESKEKK